MPLLPVLKGSLQPGEPIVKDIQGRCIVLYKDGTQNKCAEVPREHLQAVQQDVSRVDKIPGVKFHHAYEDDGRVFINLAPPPSPARLPAAEQNEVFGLSGHMQVPPGQYPTPLVPFAGCDKKAPPPSPAKPFSLTASPVKPSPLKERVDHATQAVVQKNWGARQAKMSQFFAKPPVQQSISEPVHRVEVMDLDC